jgi:hypothetical protein
MAKIYAKASQVIVWLGDVANNSDQALETICTAAKEQCAGPLMDKAITIILERDWFKHI